MIKLTHLIYCSTATQPFSADDLADLLEKARDHNTSIDVTGMLLHESGSFFQVIEGSPETIETLFRAIENDARHTKVITIIHEPILKRSFADWTMGYSSITAQEVGEIVGSNDFFGKGNSLVQLDSGRAKKLLGAFRQGRWHARVKSGNETRLDEARTISPAPVKASSDLISAQIRQEVSFAFQPIVNTSSREVVAYDALVRNLNNQLISMEKIRDYRNNWPDFDNECRLYAIELASRLEITCDLTLGFEVGHVGNAHASIQSIVETANRFGLDTHRIVLRVYQDNLIGEPEMFARMLQGFRGAGLKLNIGRFGTGRASPDLLELYHPDSITLNAQLVSGIEFRGARQAIVRGVHQTCVDLGIELIVNHLDSYVEFDWFKDEGIELCQGNLIAPPKFETLGRPQFPDNKEK